MAVTEKMYGELSESRLDEITEKIEMEWEGSVCGIVVFWNSLSDKDRESFLNIVGQLYGKTVKFPENINDIIKFSAEYLVSRGVDVSERPGIQVLNLHNSENNLNHMDKELYDMAMFIGEEHKHGGR